MRRIDQNPIARRTQTDIGKQAKEIILSSAHDQKFAYSHIFDGDIGVQPHFQATSERTFNYRAEGFIHGG
jgi:hypothetical protein